MRKTLAITCVESDAPMMASAAVGIPCQHDPHWHHDAAISPPALAGIGASYTHGGDTVHALIAIGCAHDRATCDHSTRLMHLADRVARGLGCDDDERQVIRLAALLHDIGKIAVPAAIRHKPGPLTAAEWASMRRHPETGRQILLQADAALVAIAPIVAAHHERWDGQGYPHQLAREAIPLSARILTVADSFDAMTSQRPYRAPITLMAARDELQRGAGSQFDPAIVPVFLAMLVER